MFFSNKMLDHEGKELQWNRGYKYFGAAKDLPGVRELFEPDPPKPIKKTRAEYMRYVDAHYFGYMDEEDGQVLPLESEAEKKARAEALDNFKMDKELEMMKKGAPIDDDWDKDIYSQEPDSKKNDQNLNEKDEKVQVVESASGEKTIRAAHVPVPTQDEIQAAMLRKKKLELLQMFASETLSSQSIEAKILLG